MRPGQHKNQNTFSVFLLVVGGHCYICMYSRRHDNSKKLFDIKKRNTVCLAGHFSIMVQPSQPHHIAYKTIFFFRHGMAIKQFYFFPCADGAEIISFLFGLVLCNIPPASNGWLDISSRHRKRAPVQKFSVHIIAAVLFFIIIGWTCNYMCK